MINVDISNIWGQVSLSDLLGIEKEIFDAHMRLTEPTGQAASGWLALPEAPDPGEMERILAAARRIRETSDVLVVVGTAAGCLGCRAAIELLQGPGRNYGKHRGDPQIFYTGYSLSTRQWQELNGLLEGRDFSLCLLGGTAAETAIAFRALKWQLERRYGTDGARQRIYAVTNDPGSPPAQMARAENWEHFTCPADAGDGFSVLSPAGLLPMAAAGLDIVQLLRGAREAKADYDLRGYDNPVWLYAASRSILCRSGNATELLAAFEPGFRQMGRWWQQLFGAAGDGLFPALAEYPGDACLPVQRNLFETILRFDAPEQKIPLGTAVKDPEGLNSLAGKTLDQVEEAAYQRLLEDHTDRGISLISVDCGPLREETLGELFWFFQLSCAICAQLRQGDSSGK